MSSPDPTGADPAEPAAAGPAAPRSSARRRRRRIVLLVVAGLAVIVLAFAAILVVPILTHRDGGSAHQEPFAEEWPTTAVAHGDDGRDRTLSVAAEDGSALDTSALEPGERIVVRGTGYDPAQGIYVAVCAIPADPSIKPGPCLGGVPETEASGAPAPEGTVQWAPSNWINDDWAWKLFGARPFDDPATGAFTAYLEVPAAADANVDCRATACAIYTRDDHTALGDRVQDLYLPVGFAG
ncbi:MAG: hypothetical protein J0G30_03795 [Actinomycetales bacterium]|nr:hypothetical protein [Actinomycetales bacterium]